MLAGAAQDQRKLCAPVDPGRDVGCKPHVPLEKGGVRRVVAAAATARTSSSVHVRPPMMCLSMAATSVPYLELVLSSGTHRRTSIGPPVSHGTPTRDTRIVCLAFSECVFPISYSSACAINPTTPHPGVPELVALRLLWTSRRRPGSQGVTGDAASGCSGAGTRYRYVACTVSLTLKRHKTLMLRRSGVTLRESGWVLRIPGWLWS
ncbi:hypothetical protein C8T65DRAFT_267212 [Cerioporus squamosus]|nr:hypothetical protein C8T65DRAFT_267212 [Cerioporus squamosus]